MDFKEEVKENETVGKPTPKVDEVTTAQRAEMKRLIVQHPAIGAIMLPTMLEVLVEAHVITPHEEKEIFTRTLNRWSEESV